MCALDDALPSRDDRAVLTHPLSQALAFLGVGGVVAVGVDALSLVDPSFQHQHASYAEAPLAAILGPLQHEILFALPLVMLIAVLARETRISRIMLGIGATACGLALTNAFVLPA